MNTNISKDHDIIEIGLIRQNIFMLTRRAATDKDFRNMCLEDADRAYLKLTSKSLPEPYAVHFIEPDQDVPQEGTVRWMRLPRYEKT